MPGVEILAIGEGMSDFEPNSAVFLFVLALCAIGGVIIGSKDKEYGFGALVGLFFGLCIGFFAAVVVGVAEIEYYPTYKVTISDEVSMNEFTNRYEILEQEGRIYTVKEIMPDAN